MIQISQEMSTKKSKQHHLSHNNASLLGFMERLQTSAIVAGQDAVTIANALGISRQTVDHWFRGRNQPRKPALKKLADFLGVQVLWLAKGTGRKELNPSDSKSSPQSTKSPRPDPSYGHEPARFGALAGNAPHDDKNPPEKILLQKYVKVLESKVTLLEELLSIRNKHVSELKRIIQGVHPPDGLAERRNCHIDLLEAIARINGIENNDEISASCGGG
jgi:transcriptional regulator with XRE-family HTH domain